MLDAIASYAGVFAGVLSFIAYVLYIRAVLKGTTKPSRSTWWILTLVGSMILFSYYAGGARDTIWVPLAYVVGPLIIAILSTNSRYAAGDGWEPLDKWCLAVSLASAVFWIFNHEAALVVLLVNLFMDFLGLVPTIKKSYLDPIHEDRPAWTLETIASAINLFAVSSWALTLDGFSIWFYPVYLLVINAIIAGLLYHHKKPTT